MKHSLALSLFPALALAACVHDVSDPEGHGDDSPELTVTGDLGETFTSDGGLLVSPALASTEPANQVALMASIASADALPALRVRAVGSSTWRDAEWTFVEAHAEGTLVAGFGALDGESDAVEVAVDEADAALFQTLTFSPAFVDDTGGDDGIEAASPEQGDALRAELAFVGVLPRSAWGARNHRCSTRDSGYSRVALHHTASFTGADAFAAARQIQAYHMDGRGYCDAAYHFGVAQDGRVLELRPLPFRGGHTRNNNANNVGVVFLGCFDAACGNQQPSAQLLESGAGTVAMMNLLYGVTINSDRVRGHRDHSGAQTACPGANLYPRLEQIRQRAREMRAGTNNPPPPQPAPQPAGCGVASANTSLARGQGARSCSGRYHFVHQTDGNVVLYDNNTALWHTGTHGRSTSSLVMPGDGNVVLYAASGAAIWSTGTHGNAGSVLAVQDDGNVVVYSGSTALWATGTNR